MLLIQYCPGNQWTAAITDSADISLLFALICEILWFSEMIDFTILFLSSIKDCICPTLKYFDANKYSASLTSLTEKQNSGRHEQLA